MKKFRVYIFLIICFLPFSKNIFGCSYIESDVKLSQDEIKKHLIENFKGAIFIGKVVSVKEVKIKWFDDETIMNEVIADIEKFWVGVEQSKIIVYTGTGGGDCSADFKVGERYFFDIDKVGGILWATFFNSKRIDLDNEEKKLKYANRIKFFDEVFGEGKGFQSNK